jgi:hypothetical protein
MNLLNKSKQVLDSTDNSRIYRLTKRRMDITGCPFCPPNGGCNRVRDSQIANHESESNECDGEPHS